MENDQRFADFVILQAQNAGMFLGKVPNPVSGTLEVNAKAARSVLDSLEMLELKTTGNRTPQRINYFKLPYSTSGLSIPRSRRRRAMIPASLSRHKIPGLNRKTLYDILQTPHLW